MLAYKVVETGTRLHVANTRQLKPSQRCAACWEIVPKTLAQRTHVCPHCGHTAQRDHNAASVLLIDAHTPGTGVAARPNPLSRQRARSKSATRETPATTANEIERRESSSTSGSTSRSIRRPSRAHGAARRK
ncbi:zinc ribbon domain-containing protein [Paraburkholderia sp. MM6662-R1]|uniref:zinc ribbon domain-containing protein n=1 Tax=Paraburkholderia sp. MM6662-R1 TaxID=2991066 RepID=UPI003D1B6364